MFQKLKLNQCRFASYADDQLWAFNIGGWIFVRAEDIKQMDSNLGVDVGQVLFAKIKLVFPNMHKVWENVARLMTIVQYVHPVIVNKSDTFLKKTALSTGITGTSEADQTMSEMIQMRLQRSFYKWISTQNTKDLSQNEASLMLSSFLTAFKDKLHTDTGIAFKPEGDINFPLRPYYDKPFLLKATFLGFHMMCVGKDGGQNLWIPFKPQKELVEELLLPKRKSSLNETEIFLSRTFGISFNGLYLYPHLYYSFKKEFDLKLKTPMTTNTGETATPNPSFDQMIDSIALDIDYKQLFEKWKTLPPREFYMAFFLSKLNKPEFYKPFEFGSQYDEEVKIEQAVHEIRLDWNDYVDPEEEEIDYTHAPSLKPSEKEEQQNESSFKPSKQEESSDDDELFNKQMEEAKKKSLDPSSLFNFLDTTVSKPEMEESLKDFNPKSLGLPIIDYDEQKPSLQEQNEIVKEKVSQKIIPGVKESKAVKKKIQDKSSDILTSLNTEQRKTVSNFDSPIEIQFSKVGSGQKGVDKSKPKTHPMKSEPIVQLTKTELSNLINDAVGKATLDVRKQLMHQQKDSFFRESGRGRGRGRGKIAEASNVRRGRGNRRMRGQQNRYRYEQNQNYNDDHYNQYGNNQPDYGDSDLYDYLDKHPELSDPRFDDDQYAFDQKEVYHPSQGDDEY
jgi:hypothetical protein